MTFREELEKNKKYYDAIVRLCYAVLMQHAQDLTSKSKKKIANTYRHQAYKFFKDKENCEWFCKITDFPYSKIEKFLENYSLADYS